MENKELIVSEANGRKWFNAYQEVDEFLFDELKKIGKDYPIISETCQELNTIEAIRQLVDHSKQ